MPERRLQLEQLAEALRELLCILALDPACRWMPHFAHCLAGAERLLRDGFSQDDLNGLSTTVRFVYGGSGSFGDYSPGTYDAVTAKFVPISGTEEFDRWAHAVHERADELRVVGQY